MKRSVSKVLAFALGVSLVGPPALAQGKDKKAKAADTKAAAPAKKKADERKGPASFKDAPKLETSEKDALADKKRDEVMEQLKKIIAKFDDGSPQKAELIFQLAENSWEKSKYLNRLETKKFQDAEKAFEEAKNRGEKAAEPKENHRESELYRSETMRLYETILRDYPAYERKDEVLFALAFNLYEIDRKEQAVQRYSELVKNYPASKFIGDTFIELGNHYFANNNLAKAKESFERAVSVAKSNPKIYSFALYRLAWCDFNAGTEEAGLAKLQQVVDYSDKQGKNFTDLKTEALNDMVVFFVKLNIPDAALKYFKEKAPKKRQARLVGKMAYGLADAGHHDSAIKVFRTMLNEDPTQADAPEFQQAIVKAYEGLRQREQVKLEIKRLAELYSPGSLWWKANETKKDVLRNAFNVAEEAMRTVVTEYHQEAQKTKQVATYRLARDIYKQYVDAFAASDDENFVADQAFNLRFYYSEILWALEEWENAASQYVAVVKFKIPARDTAKEVSDEKYRQSAAFNAVLAFDKLVKIERGILQKSELKEGQKVEEQKKKGNVEKGQKVVKRTIKELQEKPLTKFEMKLVESCDTYNGMFPNNPDEIDVRYQAAVVYYDKNHFVEAARRLGEVILKWPEERRSQDAADLTMYTMEEKEEWLELNKLSRSFLGNKKLAKPGTEFAKRITNLVEGSLYKWVDEVIYRKEKNPAKAADEFLKFVAEFPQSDKADRALTYVQDIALEANQLDRAVEAGERVLKEYPGSVFEHRVRYNLAGLYEKVAQFQKSAEMNEAFIAGYDAATNNADVPKELLELRKKEEAAKKGKPAAKDAKKDEKGAKTAKVVNEEERKSLLADSKKNLKFAQFNAALWWEGLGQSDKAIAAYNLYMVRFKDEKDVPAIQYNIGLIYEKDKKLPEGVKAFETFNATYAKDTRATAGQHYQAKYKQFLTHTALKSGKDAERIQDELVKTFPKLPETERKDVLNINAFAHARFVGLEPLWKSYVDIKLVKVATLKKDLVSKQKKIQDVEKAYLEVLNTGSGEWGIAALTRIGLSYADFAQNILDSPDPKGFDEEQTEMYRGELENLAFPLEEKAIEGLEKATAKAYELSLYNEWTLLAQDKINKYRPGYYAKVKDVSYQGSEFFVTSPLLTDSGLAQVEAPAPAAPATPVSAPPANPPTKAQSSESAGAGSR